MADAERRAPSGALAGSAASAARDIIAVAAAVGDLHRARLERARATEQRLGEHSRADARAVRRRAVAEQHAPLTLHIELTCARLGVALRLRVGLGSRARAKLLAAREGAFGTRLDLHLR